MRKIRGFFTFAIAVMFMGAFSQAVSAQQIDCNMTTELRNGVEWHVLQEDCDTIGHDATNTPNIDLNQKDLNMIQPVVGFRVMGPVIKLAPNSNLINGYVNTVDLNPLNFCATGDNRLMGVLIRNAVNVTIANVTIANINFGPNVVCPEGFGVRTDGNTFMRGTVRLKNVKVENYQRAGLVALGTQDVYLDNSEIGECSNEAVQDCTTVQVSGGAAVYATNSKLAQNSNKSGLGNRIAVALLLSSTGPQSVLTNVQFREGNAERAIWVASNTNSPVYDNLKISETGDDGPFATDIAIEDLGFGAVIKNMDFDAKIRGYDQQAFFAIPVVSGLRMMAASAPQGNVQILE